MICVSGEFAFCRHYLENANSQLPRDASDSRVAEHGAAGVFSPSLNRPLSTSSNPGHTCPLKAEFKERSRLLHRYCIWPEGGGGSGASGLMSRRWKRWRRLDRVEKLRGGGGWKRTSESGKGSGRCRWWKGEAGIPGVTSVRDGRSGGTRW